MPGQEDALGLELRLPWGGRSPRLPKPMQESPPPPEPPAADPAPREPAVAAPEGSVAAAPVGSVGAPAPRAPVLNTDEVQRSLEALLVVIQGRFDRMEERLADVETRSSSGQADPATVELVEQRIGSASQEIERRIDRLEALVTASHRVTMEAVGQLAADDGPAQALAPDLVARLERLEALLDTTERRAVQAVAELSAGVAQLASRLDAVDGALQGRTDQVSSRIDSSQRAVLGALNELAPRRMVAELAENVVARGESVDGELTELRRLLSRSAEALGSLGSSTSG